MTIYRCHSITYADMEAGSPEEAAALYAEIVPSAREVYVGEPEPDPCASRLVRLVRLSAESPRSRATGSDPVSRDSSKLKPNDQVPYRFP